MEARRFETLFSGSRAEIVTHGHDRDRRAPGRKAVELPPGPPQVLPAEPEAAQVLREAVGVVRRLLRRARDGEEAPAGLGERAALPGEPDHLGELHPVEEVELPRLARREELLQRLSPRRLLGSPPLAQEPCDLL